MKNNIINKKNINFAIKLQIFIIILLLIFLFYFGNFNDKNFFHIGPSNEEVEINIFGYNINSWNKWFVFMIILIIIQLMNTFSYKIYKNWYNNLVKDPKSKKILFDKNTTIKYITIWKSITWFTKIFNLTLFMTTKQLQFSFPQFISRLIMSNIIDYEYIKYKKK